MNQKKEGGQRDIILTGTGETRGAFGADLTVSSIHSGIVALGRDLPSAFREGVREPLSDSLRGNLNRAIALPPDARALMSIYALLQEQLRPSGKDGDDPNIQIDSSIRAWAIAGRLLNQTSQPLKERFSHRYAITGAEIEDSTLIAEIQGAFATDEETMAMRTGLIESAERYMDTLHTRMMAITETPEQTMAQAADMQTILAQTNLDNEQTDQNFHAWNIRMAELQANGVLSVARSPHAATLLLSGEFRDFHTVIRGEAFIGGVERTHHVQEEPDRSTAQQLADFYFKDPDVQRYFWSRVYQMNGEGFEGVTDFFFSQSPDVARRFILSSTLEENTLIEGDISVLRLLGIIAEFQNRNKDSGNLRVIRRALEIVAKNRHMSKYISPALQVLTDNAPGAIFKALRGAAWTATLEQGESWEEFLAQTAENRTGERRVLYESPPRVASPVTVSVEAPEQARTVVFEAAEKREMLEITAGELVEDSRWPNVRRVPLEEVPRVLAHLQSQLQPDPEREEELLKRLIASQEAAAEEAPEQKVFGQETNPALLPLLFPPAHPLYPLQSLGFVSIESVDDRFSIILDPEIANITTSAPGRIVLEGNLNAENNLELGGAPEDFRETPLHLLLTDAAQTTLRAHNGEVNLSKVKKSISKFNQSIDTKHFPQIIPPTEDDAREINRGNAVLVPIGNDYVLSELDWKDVKKAA